MIINQIICGCLIYFSAEKLYTYFIIVNLGVLSYSGHIILYPSLIHSKFGVENSVILLGISGTFSGIAALIGPILTYFVKDLEDYLITYLVGESPSIISLFLAIFIKTDKMVYIEQKINDNIDVNGNNKLVDRYSLISEKNDNH